MRAVPLLVLAFLAACQPQAGPAPDNQAAAANESAAGNAAQAPAQAQPFKIEAKDEVLEFGYAWPAQAAAIPALDQWLRGNMAHRRTRMTRLAQAGAEDARRNGYPVRPYVYRQDWSVAADTPALLVLHADAYEYTGGAHGMPLVATVVWDKAKGERLATAALFDVAALARVTKARFCAALDARRAEKRGAPVDSDAADEVPEFVRCVPLERQEIVPVSKGGQGIDAIRVVILPYEAGPYSEGIYTIELPVDAAMLETVKPAWRAAFSQGATKR